MASIGTQTHMMSPASGDVLHLVLRNSRAGAGQILGSRSHPPVWLSAERESVIRERLALMRRVGCGAKIQELFDELFRMPFLSKESLSNWYAEFAETEDDEGMALSIAALVASILRPSLASSEDVREQSSLITLENQAQEIIGVLLPEVGDVKAFIEDCEEGLEGRRLLQESQRRVHDTGMAKIEAVGARMRDIDSRRQRSFDHLKGRLQVLQRGRREAHGGLPAEIASLRGLVDQIDAQIRSLCGDDSVVSMLRDMVDQIDDRGALRNLGEKVEERGNAAAADDSLDREIVACMGLLEREVVCSTLGPVEYLRLRLSGRDPEALIGDDIEEKDNDLDTALLLLVEQRMERGKAAEAMIKSFMDRASSIDLTAPKWEQIEALKNRVEEISRLVKGMKEDLDAESLQWKKLQEEAQGYRESLKSVRTMTLVTPKEAQVL